MWKLVGESSRQDGLDLIAVLQAGSTAVVQWQKA